MNTLKWVATLMALSVPFLGIRAQTPDSGPPPPENSTAPSVSPAPSISPAASDVVRMAEAGTSEDVLVAYVKNSNSRYELSADQILYLRDVGLTSPVITAMLNRDSELKTQPQAAPTPASAPPSQPGPPPQPAPVTDPPPAPTGANSAPVEAPRTPPTSLQPALMEATAPAYVSSPPVEVSYFYDSLSPYGTWVQLDGVGWCWQPRAVVVNRAWQPYCNSGHWVYTDAGWFWQSDYSWGWAPFHYGRWHLHERCGWVWLPDRVWGPAWVTWRYEHDHCGWAPLPPHADFDVHVGFRFNGVHVASSFDFGLHPAQFTFISLHDFNNHDYAHHRLPPTQVTQIYNHTTVINNYVVNNNTVVNQGIKVEHVQEATHTEVKKVAIRDTPALTPGSAPRAAGKNELAVYRPELKAPAKPVTMVAQKVDDRHPVIQHAPIAPPKSQRPLVAESTTSNNRGSQERMSRPGTDRTTSSTQAQQANRPAHPADSASATTSARNTAQVNTANTASPANGPAKRPEMDRSQPNHTSAPSQGASGQQYYPLRTGSTDTSHTSPGQSSQAYYPPKSQHQANEARGLPPASSNRPSDPHSQATMNPRPPLSNDSKKSSSDSSKSSGGSSNKNDR